MCVALAALAVRLLIEWQMFAAFPRIVVAVVCAQYAKQVRCPSHSFDFEFHSVRCLAQYGPMVASSQVNSECRT